MVEAVGKQKTSRYNPSGFLYISDNEVEDIVLQEAHDENEAKAWLDDLLRKAEFSVPNVTVSAGKNYKKAYKLYFNIPFSLQELRNKGQNEYNKSVIVTVLAIRAWCNKVNIDSSTSISIQNGGQFVDIDPSDANTLTRFYQ